MPESKLTAERRRGRPGRARPLLAGIARKVVGADEFMYSFHAKVKESSGTLFAFGEKAFDKLVADFSTYLPPGRSRQLTINLLAYIIMSLKQLLTFTTDSAGTKQYGKFDAIVCNSARFEKIKAWLLDETACPTEWEPLITLRRQQRRH